MCAKRASIRSASKQALQHAPGHDTDGPFLNERGKYACPTTSLSPPGKRRLVLHEATMYKIRADVERAALGLLGAVAALSRRYTPGPCIGPGHAELKPPADSPPQVRPGITWPRHVHHLALGIDPVGLPRMSARSGVAQARRRAASGFYPAAWTCRNPHRFPRQQRHCSARPSPPALAPSRWMCLIGIGDRGSESAASVFALKKSPSQWVFLCSP